MNRITPGLAIVVVLTVCVLAFSVTLLEAAFATSALDTGGYYDKVIPTFDQSLRMLISHSNLDYALRDAFPAGHDLTLFAVAVSRYALGFTGPTAFTTGAFPSNSALSVAWGSRFVGAVAAPPHTSAFVVADLTPIHSDPKNTFNGGLSGHHSDIFLPEIYNLMSWFLFA